MVKGSLIGDVTLTGSQSHHGRKFLAVPKPVVRSIGTAAAFDVHLPERGLE